MVARQVRHEDLIGQARARLAEHATGNADLAEKLRRAGQSDASWRGAAPLDQLEGRCLPVHRRRDTTLVGVDGSQIYPDRHGIATYYLINTGSIVLRQGTGETPSIASHPRIYFDDADVYDEGYRVRDAEYINRLRHREELATTVELAEAERTRLGGDIGRPILALTDGPLLPWMPLRAGEADLRRDVEHAAEGLDRLRRAHVIPVGYIDRPSSAYVLRTLELADMPIEEINRRRLRQGPFRQITDRLLFGDLKPNERTALFASTSELNQHFAEAGHRVVFFYANMARASGANDAIIARIELPEWAARDVASLDSLQQALSADCALTGYPYVLARAHELAVVSNAERAQFDSMIERSMLRCGLRPATSIKAEMKRLTGAHRR
jgi:hypothetical protein